NLSYVLNEVHPTKPGRFEWTNLFERQLNPTLLGRYGSKDNPPFQNAAPTGSAYQSNIASPGQFPHFYAPVDYDACNNDPLNNRLALSYPATPPFGPGFPFSTGGGNNPWFFSIFGNFLGSPEPTKPPVWPTGKAYLHLDNTAERAYHPSLYNYFDPQRNALN